MERELGRGGMGVAYLARQESRNRSVVLKFIGGAARLTLLNWHASALRLGPSLVLLIRTLSEFTMSAFVSQAACL